MDLDTVDAHLPPEVLAGEGTMVAYAEIFPWAEAFEFIYQGAPCFVDDQYCVRPGCACTDAGLSFFRSSQPKRPWSDASRDFALVRYDYRAGLWKLESGRLDNSAAHDLMRAVSDAHPDLRDSIRRRHGQLKRLAGRLLPGTAWTPERKDDPENESSLPLASPPQPVRAPFRPGRNDPCPCGSGKKFKKCCGSF